MSAVGLWRSVLDRHFRTALVLLALPMVLQALWFELRLASGAYSPEPLNCVTAGGSSGGWASPHCDYGLFGPMFDAQMSAVFLVVVATVAGVVLAAAYLVGAFVVAARTEHQEVAYAD